MSQEIKAFVDMYFAAELRAVPTNTLTGIQLKFKETDKLAISNEVKRLIATKVVFDIKDLVNRIVYYTGVRSDYSKHYNRLQSYTKSLSVNKKEVTEIVVTQTESSAFAFKQNLRHSLKSLCKAGVKNSVSGEELLSICRQVVEESEREYLIQLNDSKLKQFLKDNGISKDLAFDILDSLED